MLVTRRYIDSLIGPFGEGSVITRVGFSRRRCSSIGGGALGGKGWLADLHGFDNEVGQDN